MNQHELAKFEQQLGFRPRPAVRWLSPPELLRTGLKALAAQVFLGFMDNRETQSIFEQQAMDLSGFPPQERGQWIDFIADLGDGFDATYTLAWALAQNDLKVDAASAGGQTITLPKSQLLIMGGDEVYPSASVRAYEDRLVRPFRAASIPGPPAALLALPGNHDWYDGLTAFERVFCQHAQIGGWQTLQSRGYFAARLTNLECNLVQKTWWLVALDSELGSYIDRPQLEYFESQVTRHLKPGDAIILCVSSPTWEDTARLPHPDPDANNSLRYFENHYLVNQTDPLSGEQHPTGAQIRVRLSGDKHHYVRYAQAHETAGADDPRGEQLLTCGLGGAFLAGAKKLSPELLLPPTGSREMVNPAERRRYTLSDTMYPTARQEQKLHRQLINPFSKYFIPRRNPWLSTGLGVLHLVLFMFLCTIFSGVTGSSYPQSLSSGQVVHALGVVAFVFVLPMLLALLLWQVNNRRDLGKSRSQGKDKPRPLAQPMIMLSLQLMWSSAIFVGLIGVPWQGSWNADWITVLLAVVYATLLGAVVGTMIFALHLILAPAGAVGRLKMTALAYEDGKGFLRMNLCADGTLVVYPVIIDTVIHDWDTGPSIQNQMRPIPADGMPRMRLLEEPIRISINGFPDPGGAQ
ncbi:hypothetical protein [Glutamicibacter sp.]|uniref:hypothetical protein n=1 Tax=Glutamicibacter sp. TaxID=1931995 RepID=UPI0028BE4094|nr:hypothetical protein [Glutamicibacter sp.]